MNVTKMENHIIEMRTGEKEIIITDNFPLSYNPGNTDYDKALMRNINVWHQIWVHHNRGYNREQILEAFYKFIPEFDFYPVAFREGKLADFLFVRCCEKALEQLFSNNCKLPMEENQSLDLTIKLGVAKYQHGQITPTEKVVSVLNQLVKKADNEGLLDLQDFANHPFLADISMNLSNTACFRMICNKINTIDAIRMKIKKISFANNDIRTLEPFKQFNQIILKTLDLRNNHVSNTCFKLSISVIYNLTFRYWIC